MRQDDKATTIMSRIARRFGYAPVDQIRRVRTKASRAAGITVGKWEMQTGVEAPSMDSLLETYSTVDWIYRVVSVIAQTAASVPLRIYTGGAEADKQEIAEGPLYDLIWRPNPWVDQSEFIEYLVAYLELTGNCYVEKVGTQKKGEAPVSETNKPVELWLLRPDRVKIFPDPDKRIAYYEYNVNGKLYKFAPSDIMHFKYIDPRSDYYGVGPMSAASMSVTGDVQASTYNLAFFANSAEPGAVLQTEQVLNKDTAARILHLWEAMHKGSRKAHRIALLDQGLKFQPITGSFKDMQFVEQSKNTGERILRAFGVPPLLAGVLEYSNYSLAIEQRKLFWESKMIPVLKRLEGVINSQLCPLFDAECWVEFDLSGVQALQQTQNEKVAVSVPLVQNDILTINEVRRMYWALDPVPWGDRPSSVLLSSGESVETMSDDEPDVEEEDVKGVMVKSLGAFKHPVKIKGDGRKMTSAKRRAIWRRFDRRLTTLERGCAHAMEGYFDEVSDALVAYVEQTYPDGLMTRMVKRVGDRPPEGFPSAEGEEELKRILEAYWKKAMEAGHKSIGEDYGLPNWHLRQEDIDRMRRILMEPNAQKIRHILDTTKDDTYRMLRDLLTPELDENGAPKPISVNQLATALRERFDEYAGNRANTIARTEMGRTLNYGMSEGMKEAGFSHKAWSAQDDEWIREGHREVNNVTVRQDEMFSVKVYRKKTTNGVESWIFTGVTDKMAYPQDPSGSAANVINCRCCCIAVEE